MFKMLMAGLVGVAMVGVGMFLGTSLGGDDSKSAGGPKAPELEQVMTDMTGAPVVVNGHVDGYLIFRVRSEVDKSKLENDKLDLSPYLASAAFEAAYTYYSKGLPSIKPSDFEAVAQLVTTIANRKLGPDVVRNVEMEQFNYVPSDKVRQNLFAK